MKKFLCKSTEIGTKSDTEFEKHLLSFMNTSLYGKTMKDVRKPMKIVIMKIVKKTSKYKFCGMKKHNTNSDNPFLVFNLNEKRNVLR